MNLWLIRRVSPSSEPDLGWRENSIQTKTAPEQERCLRSELSSLRWIPVAQAYLLFERIRNLYFSSSFNDSVWRIVSYKVMKGIIALSEQLLMI